MQRDYEYLYSKIFSINLPIKVGKFMESYNEIYFKNTLLYQKYQDLNGFKNF